MTMRSKICAVGIFATTAVPCVAGTITPDIIFGSGNTNRGFTVTTDAVLELGLRAKRRYTTPDDRVGDGADGEGIVIDSAGNYLLDFTGQTVPANRSVWNYDWSINTDTSGGSTKLSNFSFLISVDYDPSAAEDMRTYDPFCSACDAYLGDNSTGNGSGAYVIAPSAIDLDTFNVAQNSVNLGFLPGAPIGAGQFRIALSAFDLQSGSEVASTSIDVFVDVDPAAVPLPAALPLLLAGLGALGVAGRRRRS